MRTRIPSLGMPLSGSAERIRATVIGASQYTVQVSSSTIFFSDISLLPQLDLQVVPAFLPSDPNQISAEGIKIAIDASFERLDIKQSEIGRQICLALLGPVIPTYDSIKAICDGIVAGLDGLPGDWPWTIILSADVAGLVGSMLKREHKAKHFLL